MWFLLKFSETIKLKELKMNISNHWIVFQKNISLVSIY
jgi:hypothetical protein